MQQDRRMDIAPKSKIWEGKQTGNKEKLKVLPLKLHKKFYGKSSIKAFKSVSVYSPLRVCPFLGIPMDEMIHNVFSKETCDVKMVAHRISKTFQVPTMMFLCNKIWVYFNDKNDH